MTPQCHGLNAQEVFFKLTAIDTHLLGHAGRKVRAHYCGDGLSRVSLIIYVSCHRNAQSSALRLA